MKKRIYRKSPIFEAVCEFRFLPGKEWDGALPGLIYEELKGQFPGREQGLRLTGQVESGPGGIQQKIVQIDTVRFISKNKRNAVQLSPHQLLISRYQPYTQWEDLLPLIQTGLKVYRSLAKPKGLQRIGLRYINHIDIKFEGDKVELEDYFDIYPYLGERLPQIHTSFIVGVEIPYENFRDVLRLQISNAPMVSETEKIMRTILDIDYFCGRAGAIGFRSVSSWLKKAHSRIENNFEGCIKDPLRTQFGEKK